MGGIAHGARILPDLSGQVDEGDDNTDCACLTDKSREGEFSRPGTLCHHLICALPQERWQRENSPRLSSELVALCGQAGQWRAVRQVQTRAWMVVGLIQAGWINLTAGVPFVHGRARYAQSTQRRCRRWLGKRRIEGAPR